MQCNLKKAMAVLLALILTVSIMAPVVAAEEFSANYESVAELTAERLEAFRQVQEASLDYGLVGFEGNYALPADSSDVSVIVMFENQTAAVQVIEAQLEGYHLPVAMAEQRVNDDHANFRQQLDSLFHNPLARTMAQSYSIEWEYRVAFNGVALTLPANMVEAVAGLPGVRAVYPDFTVYAPEPIIDEYDYYFYAPHSLDTPRGMRAGRARMEADFLHAMGITGEGVLVAVLDTGIDWKHPAFTGTFPTQEWMAGRGINISNDELLNINVYTYGPNLGLPRTGQPATYYFVGRDMMQADQANIEPQDYPRSDIRGLWMSNNPMETSPFHRLWDIDAGAALPGGPTWAQMTDHGSHVAGTIVGQAVEGHADSILGIAPGAKAIHYRVLGFGGSGPSTVVMAGMEMANRDGADVVNMSLGGGAGCAMRINTMAVNNIMLSNPNITFVISAGNSGTAFFSTGNAGAATMAITVAGFNDAGNWAASSFGFHGGNANVPIFTGDARWNGNWTELPNGNVVFGNDLENTTGVHTIYAMPQVYAGAAPIANHVGVGAPADFIALVQEHVDPYFDPAGDLLEALAEIDYFQGSWVMIRRGFTFVDIIAMANALGMAGVVQGNNQAGVPAIAAANAHVPFLSLPTASGVNFAYYLLNEADGISTFTLDTPVVPPPTLAGSSSRGPVRSSYEIKPDIGAHGWSVWSVRTSWRPIGQGINAGNWFERMQDPEIYAVCYGNMSGTSMSAPHVSGAVALMVQYSNDNNLNWTNEDMKIRIMNTAETLPVNTLGPFDGARQINVRRAIEAEEMVYVTLPFINVNDDDFIVDRDVVHSARTGSFSFKRVAPGETAWLPMTIVNESTQDRTYTITIVQNLTAREAQPGATLNLDGRTVMVRAGRSVALTMGITLPADAALRGHFVGYVVVSHGDRVVARLPYAAVAVSPEDIPPPVEDLILLRPVISTGEYAHSIFGGYDSDGNPIYRALGSYLTVLYTANSTFEMDIAVYRVVEDGEDVRLNDLDATFHSPSMFNNLMGSTLRQHRGVVVFGEGLNLEEGEYRLVLKVMHNIGRGWVQAQDTIEKTFWVDNTPPVLDSLYITIDGLEEPVPFGELAVITDELMRQTDYIVVTGNVSDLGLDNLIAREATFDIWRSDENRQASIENNLAVFVGLTPIEYETADITVNGVNFGANTAANQTIAHATVTGVAPVRAQIDPLTGNFTAKLEGLADVNYSWNITVWALDNFSPHPVFNTNMLVAPVFATGFVERGSSHFMPNHMLISHGGAGVTNGTTMVGLPTDLNTGFNTTWWVLNSVLRGRHGWIGSNITDVTTNIVSESYYFGPFTLDLFNNGEGGSPSRPNASLAAAGLIRMWTQLNGVNTRIPLRFADTIVALDQDENCAEDFLRIGRVWQDGAGWLDYFNLIDVNKNEPWQYINFSITVYGQTVDLLLVNANYPIEPPPCCEYGDCEICNPPCCEYGDCEICNPPCCEYGDCEICNPVLTTFILATNNVTVSNTNRHVSVFVSGTATGPITLNLLDSAPELVLQVRDNLWTPTGNVEGLVIGVAGNATITESRTVTLEVTRDGVTVLLSIELVAN
ncbi:MAG: S8 family serine peptidase [Firmicutes bacterium]|nr:S8 family serine peptidase [Bacillota bacterium]